jgi:hypothetical protein
MMNEGWQIVDRYKNTKRDNMPMDETIISFADRIIDLFEMVNQENGGSKMVENNTVVYKIPSEKPVSVYELLTFDEELPAVKASLENEIITSLLHGDKEAKARAAYYAVALDMAKDMKKKYPKQWKEGCYNLSGYWKVITNIFHGGGFKSLVTLKEKFVDAGFIPLISVPKTEDLFTDLESWKDPKTLYDGKKMMK